MWAFTMVLVFALEDLVGVVDYFLTSSADGVSQYRSEFDNWGLDIIQIILVFITIYMLAIYRKL